MIDHRSHVMVSAALLLVASTVGACQQAAPKQQPSRVPEQKAAARESVPPALTKVAPPIVGAGASTTTIERRPPGEAGIEPPPAVGLQKARGTKKHEPSVDTLSVGQLLARQLVRGERVFVRGSCLDQFHASGSVGAPPRTRSDWQLTDGNRVIYVVGRFPAACAGETTVIAAIVDVDTIGTGASRRPRPYLVIAR